MKIWHFSETAYPYLPDPSGYESVRVDLPNRYYDPEKGAALFDRFIEEWQVAEEEGLRDHAQRASSDADLRRSGRPAAAWPRSRASPARRGS